MGQSNEREKSNTIQEDIILTLKSSVSECFHKKRALPVLTYRPFEDYRFSKCDTVQCVRCGSSRKRNLIPYSYDVYFSETGQLQKDVLSYICYRCYNHLDNETPFKKSYRYKSRVQVKNKTRYKNTIQRWGVYPND